MCRDVFILIPVTGKYVSRKKSGDMFSEKYARELTKTANYECEELISSSLKRDTLDNIEVAYMDDEYKLENAEWVAANAIISYQEKTQLGVFQLIILQAMNEVTQYGDMVASQHLYIRNDGEVLEINKFIENTYLLNLCGKIRTIYCMKRNDASTDEIQYMLAGEAIVSKHADYRIDNNTIKSMAESNLASYDFYDLYASSNAIVYCTNNFSDKLINNLEEEALLLFICEIAVLQNSAISRINKRIVDELMANSDISTRKTLKLQVEFGKTILLWDNCIYNYYMAQRLSDKIIEAFETDKLFDEYQKNKQHIEQIASLKSGIASEIEGRILNILAFVLSISEVIKLIGSIKNYVVGIPLKYGLAGGTTVALIIIILAIIRNRKRHS